MGDFMIEVREDGHIVVFRDCVCAEDREVVFEGSTFEQCFRYVKKKLKKKSFDLVSSFLFEPYTDRKGRSFPYKMRVIA